LFLTFYPGFKLYNFIVQCINFSWMFFQSQCFITENLTKYRTELVKQLAELKYNGLLYTYWTSDGRIFLKQNTTSRKILINNRDDILDFIHSTEHDTST
jgi:hypothetical protein